MRTFRGRVGFSVSPPSVAPSSSAAPFLPRLGGLVLVPRPQRLQRPPRVPHLAVVGRPAQEHEPPADVRVLLRVRVPLVWPLAPRRQVSKSPRVLVQRLHRRLEPGAI